MQRDTQERLVVIDVDIRKNGEESFERLAAMGDIPFTAKAKTGGGGFHLYLRSPTKIRSGPLAGFEGIDIKAEGGMVIAPPSIHPDGGAYSWEVHPSEGIALIPSWLRKLLTPYRAGQGDGKGKAKRSKQVEFPRLASQPPTPVGVPLPRNVGSLDAITRAAIERYPIQIPGTRHATMLLLTGELRRAGYTETVVADVARGWTDWFRQAGMLDASDAEADDDIRRMVRNTFEKPGFAPISKDYRDRIRQFSFSDHEQSMIDGTNTRFPEFQKYTPQTSTAQRNRSVTRNTGRLWDSDAELRFLEAWVIRGLITLRADEWFFESGLPRMVAIDQSISEIIELRHGVKVHRQQIDRLKSKYVTRLRPGNQVCPAMVCELVREVEKGQPRWEGTEKIAGIPSLYEPTGLLLLIEDIANCTHLTNARSRSKPTTGGEV